MSRRRLPLRLLVSLGFTALAACSSGTTRSNFGADDVDAGGGGGGGGGSGGGGFTDSGTTGPGQDGCSEAAKLVYVVDINNGLHSFYPATLTFKTIGTLSCPSPGTDELGQPGTPNSMAVDRSGVAWVNFTSGKLFKVSTTDASCSATSFNPTKYGTRRVGMGFSSNSAGAKEETLFVTPFNDDPLGGASTGSGLAKIDLGTFALTQVGDFTNGLGAKPSELTGTGDGQLFGFFTTSPAKLAEIDKASAGTPTTGQKTLTGVSTGNAWAFSFWGGDFWFYTSGVSTQNPNETSKVTQYKKSGDGSIAVVKSSIGFNIVGAGVSTCAPTTPPK
ncbi:MAG: hypothetical protein JWM74_2774 [Myxococcaceae bacterium]|nr:hypothetical protein [Myxococcaceae bacterium]